MSSFQNRLSHFNDKRNARLVNNDITRSGYGCDCIHIEGYRDTQYNLNKTRITGFSFVPVILPQESFEGLDIRVSTKDGNRFVHLINIHDEKDMIAYIASSQIPIDRDHLLFTCISNYANESEPVILLLKIKNLKAHFGGQNITHKSYVISTEDPSTLPAPLLSELLKASEKRTSMFLAEHQREQF